MTSDSLQCLHQYFDLVYELATKNNKSESTSNLSAALDVMWEIAIEAETDTVAQSCGVFILSFYMKPAVHQQQKNNTLESAVSDNILNLINGTTTTQAPPPPQVVAAAANKWEGRRNFVDKCMDYIGAQSASCNYRAVHRCLDLLETFIECTRPGVMRGEFGDAAEDIKADAESSSIDSVVYKNGDKWSSFRRSAPWDLGPHAISWWRLPIGVCHFIRINVCALRMQKETKKFEIMISKYSRCGELQDLIAAILNEERGLLQMQAMNSISLTAQIESASLESLAIGDGCLVTVMSILNTAEDPALLLAAPDGATIVSTNRFYISVLLELLESKSTDETRSRVWNLLMRLPFNVSVVDSLMRIDSSVNWNLLIDPSSTFKLLYSLQMFDSVMIHCSLEWLDSLMALHGLHHLYYTLIHFKFDYSSSVLTYASYRALYMLLRIFASLSSHELIESDPLFCRCEPRHATPKCIVGHIHCVSGVLSAFAENELDVVALGRKIFELVTQIVSAAAAEDCSGSKILAECVDLALYELIATLFFYSSRLSPLFVSDKWCALVRDTLFCSDKSIRQCVVAHLYQIFVKFTPQQVHDATLHALFCELKSIGEEGRHYICGEFFSFYGLCIQHYVRNMLYLDSSCYSEVMRYFLTPLQYAYAALKSYDSLESKYNSRCDEYLLGLLSLMRTIISSSLRFQMKLMRQLKNELIFNCLFAVADPFCDDPVGVLNGSVATPRAKCQTSASRAAAFDLLVEIAAKNSPQLWNEMLTDFLEIHSRRMSSVDLEFGFNPCFARRSASTGECGLHNYGCTCYMNATMQQLYANPVIRRVVLGVECCDKSSVFYAMQAMFSDLMWSDERAVWPQQFLANYRDFEGNKLDPNEQMDAHEFFNFLFDNLERELRVQRRPHELSLLKSEFCGKEVNRIICQECGYVSETFVPMYAVSCAIRNHLTLEESLRDEPIWLKGGNAYRCGKCEKKVTALKKSCFTSLPATMLVHLQRFEFNLETMLRVKINSELRFPKKLNMAPYTDDTAAAEDEEEEEYELVGITVHSGMADIGHYYSFIRKQSNDGSSLGDWCCFNDDVVSPFSVETMPDKCFGGNKVTLVDGVQRWCAKSNNAYILVYRRCASLQPLPPLEDTSHLHEIAENVHWNNTRFDKKCQLCDINFVEFYWRFFHLTPLNQSSSLPPNRSSSDSIRASIGGQRSKLILYFVWDILCKFEEKSNNSKLLLPQWCEFVRQVFTADVCSAYQFVYLLCSTRKRSWCRYLLESKNVAVRQCFLDCLHHAIQCLLHHERPLYYLRATDDTPIVIDYTARQRHVEWFTSASVIVLLLDEMCRCMLIATAYWRRLSQFWLFFDLFAACGAQEEQLLADRHLIVECYRFYLNKNPFEYGLKQFVFNSEEEEEEEEKEKESLKIKYDRRKMGSADSEPDVANMIQMLSRIICSKTLSMPCADKRLLCDPKIWCKFMEDQQNPQCLAKILCHLCWQNADVSRKTCRALVNYFEEYHDNVYQSAFVICRALLNLDDVDHPAAANDDDDTTIHIYKHTRIDRLLTPIIKMMRDWYRDNKYMQSIAKCAQFLDEIAQTNDAVANYLRCRAARNDQNIQWLQHFLNSHSYYLNAPRPPTFT
eukprot:384305_1